MDVACVLVSSVNCVPFLTNSDMTCRLSTSPTSESLLNTRQRRTRAERKISLANLKMSRVAVFSVLFSMLASFLLNDFE